MKALVIPVTAVIGAKAKDAIWHLQCHCEWELIKMDGYIYNW